MSGLFYAKKMRTQGPQRKVQDVSSRVSKQPSDDAEQGPNPIREFEFLRAEVLWRHSREGGDC